MSRRTRNRPPRYVRETTEARLSDRLRALSVDFEQSRTLDHACKIDILVTRIPPLENRYQPIGVQITQKRGAVAKIVTFFERAPAGTNGPLLYVEVHGRVSLAMAVALKTAMTALWLEATRRRRKEHRLAITQSGAYWWLSARVSAKRS